MNVFTARAVTGGTPGLVAALTEIHRMTFPQNMQFSDAPRYFDEALADERNVNILLQDQNETIVGYLLGIPQSHVFEELRQWDPEFQDDPERLYLEMIQILPAQRGSKLGLRLIQRVCAEAEKRNIFKLSMHARTATGWSEYLRRIFAEARFLRQLENWYGFCEPFDYLEATTTLRMAENAGDSFLAATVGSVA